MGVSLILSRAWASTSDRYERHDINVKAGKKCAKHIGLPPFQLPLSNLSTLKLKLIPEDCTVSVCMPHFDLLIKQNSCTHLQLAKT